MSFLPLLANLMTGNMAHKREIKTCNRCRLLKLRCDRTKPSCQRCAEAHLGCTFSQQPSSTSITDTQSSTSSTGTSAPMSASLDNSSPTQPTSMSNEGHNRGHDISKDNPAAGSDSVKKRQRAHLSCARCRRLKVKCNKDLPCSRCRASGWGRNCAYNHRAYTEKLSSEPSVQDMGEAPDKTLGLWHSQPRSRTHWKQLISAVSTQSSTACRHKTATELSIGQVGSWSSRYSRPKHNTRGDQPQELRQHCRFCASEQLSVQQSRSR